MDLLGDPFASKNSPSKNLLSKPNNNNSSNLLLNQQWKTQEDYKRDIISLELQNQKYRNQLYELGQTVNKILDKVKVPSKNYGHTPNLQQQLQLVKKQLHNVNQFIQIYQKQLSVLNNKKKKDQVQNLASTQQLLKSKTDQLAALKKQVRELSHKNKGLQYKLLQYSKKNKIKSVDQQALQLKQLINENKSLKIKLQELQHLQQKRQKWLQNNIQSAKELEQKVQDQESKLPKIQSRKSLQKQRTLTSSLPKLQSEKKIYTKWLQSSTNKIKNTALEKQLQDLQKINKLVQTKISSTTQQIKEIQQQIDKLKQRVEEEEQRQNKQRQIVQKQQIKSKSISSKQYVSEESVGKGKKKHVGTMVAKKQRKIRKDWVGKFDGLRFSDNRFIKEQCRLYKVLFNTNGYCQFFYYSHKDNKKRFNSKLPFDTATLLNPGKQSTFTVEYPDFIKNIRLKLNIKTYKITKISLVSNLGIQAQFEVDTNLHSLIPTNKNSQKITTVSKQQQPEVNYEMDIKANEAITCLFGSYGTKFDEKKVITHAWLQGLGAEIIEDFVQQLI